MPNRNLYPPIVPTYSPAFIIHTNDLVGCNLNFSMPQFNSVDDFSDEIEISIEEADNAISVLNFNQSPVPDDRRIVQDRYYIKGWKNYGIGDSQYSIPLRLNDFAKDENNKTVLRIDTFYKVRLRFWARPFQTKLQSVNTTQDASEWSTVNLIIGISQPTITINNFPEITSADQYFYAFDQIDILGFLEFENPDDTETLKSYKVFLYDEKENLILESEDIYTGSDLSANEINYTLKQNFNAGEYYRFYVEYTTLNDYKGVSRDYKFAIIEYHSDMLLATFNTEPDEENGRMGVHIKGITSDYFKGNILIRRTSNKSNYQIWEDVHIETFSKREPLDYIWYDNTVESGVMYKYGGQKLRKLKSGVIRRGLFVQQIYPSLMLFEDNFLVGDNKNLKLRFDSQINTFKINSSLNKIDTLGNQFPYFQKTDKRYYKEFDLKGTISFQMDDDQIFLTKEDLFGDEVRDYEDYIQGKDLCIDNKDWFREKKFRDKVMDFLQADKIRLFRSNTEGNLLVKLSNISFSPIQSLSRYLYQFSCTVTEVQPETIYLDDLYDIQTIGEYQDITIFEYKILAQYDYYKDEPRDMLNLDMNTNTFSGIIPDKHQNDGITVQYLSWFRIEFYSKPVMWVDSNKEFLGYKIEVDYINENGFKKTTQIEISKRGFYELRGSNIKVVGLRILNRPQEKRAECLIDYVVDVKDNEIQPPIPFKTELEKKIGQVRKSFNYGEQVFDGLELPHEWIRRYHDSAGDIIRAESSLLSIDGIRVEALPNAVFRLKEFFDTEYGHHLIGPTGYLQFNQPDTLVLKGKFEGYYLRKATDSDKRMFELPDDKFRVVTKGSLKHPIKNGVYNFRKYGLEIIRFLDDETMLLLQEKFNVYSREIEDLKLLIEDPIIDINFIFFQGHWRLWDAENQIAIAPVDATIDIIFETQVEYYNEADEEVE